MIQSIKIIPYPEGKDFAVTFVDDTDLSTRKNTEPVYDILNSLDIRGTKTVWVSRQKRTSSFRREEEKTVGLDHNCGSTLEDEDYLDFIWKLKRQGFEIALHGVAAGNSYRNEIFDGIERFRDLLGNYPVMNIFHERNIENLYGGAYKLDFLPFRILERLTDKSNYLGHIEGSPYFWGDIAKDTIKYMRLPFHTISKVNTLKVNPNMPYHDPERPYVNYWFTNSDGSDCLRFKRLLSKGNLSQLERENGACLVYTHFAKGFAKEKNGSYVLDEEFIDVLHCLEGYSNIWRPTASKLLDRLLMMKGIGLTHVNYDVCLKNTGSCDVEDVSLKVPEDFELVDDNHRVYKALNGKINIKMVPAGASVTFKANKKGRTIIAPRSTLNISHFEKIKIEMYNYYGLLKQNVSLKFKYSYHNLLRKIQK